MHYILTNKLADDQSDAILSGQSIHENSELNSYQRGISLQKMDCPIIFKLDEFSLRGKMTDHLSIDDIPGPVFSLKTKALLESAGISNIEYNVLMLLDEYPESVEDGESFFSVTKRPIEYANYLIANVVGLVDCVDHEKSELEYFYPPELRTEEHNNVTGQEEINDPFAGENPNDIDFITRLVLDQSKIDPSIKIFRLLDQPDLLIFHESIVDLIKKARLTGFVFVPVSEYTEVIPDDDDDEADNNMTPEPAVPPKEAKKSKYAFSLD